MVSLVFPLGLTQRFGEICIDEFEQQTCTFMKKISLSTSFDPEVIGLKDLIKLRYSYINSAFFDTLINIPILQRSEKVWKEITLCSKKQNKQKWVIQLTTFLAAKLYKS